MRRQARPQAVGRCPRRPRPPARSINSERRYSGERNRPEPYNPASAGLPPRVAAGLLWLRPARTSAHMYRFVPDTTKTVRALGTDLLARFFRDESGGYLVLAGLALPAAPGR